MSRAVAGMGQVERTQSLAKSGETPEEIDDVPQIKNLIAKELTLRRFEFEACAEDTSEDGEKIVEVLSKATRKD